MVFATLEHPEGLQPQEAARRGLKTQTLTQNDYGFRAQGLDLGVDRKPQTRKLPTPSAASLLRASLALGVVG